MQPGTLQLTSPAFKEGAAIPVTYSCKGQNISPPLTISGTPYGTKSLALILHDPDAPSGDFLHWTVWNIAPGTTSIAENSVPDAAVQGTIGSGKIGYFGPCPPSGTHRYIFELYALDNTLSLLAGASRQELIDAMDGHTLAQTALTGTYSVE